VNEQGPSQGRDSRGDDFVSAPLRSVAAKPSHCDLSLTQLDQKGRRFRQRFVVCTASW
jgi:hypothetical protein